MSLSRAQVREAFSSVAVTRDFRHLKPVPRWWTRRQTWMEPSVHVVKPKDRIKYWNIVPGDQVRLMGDTKGTIYEVNMINKLSNRVLLKTEQNTEVDPRDQRSGKNVPYARCQLFIGKYEFPDRSETVPVFAKRLGTSAPSWNLRLHQWYWNRYATATDPRLPHWEPGHKERILIPWPKRTPPHKPEPTPYDTKENAVLEVTYVPPQLPTYTHFSEPAPAKPSENDYIKSLSNSEDSPYDPTLPAEIFLSNELANPHSRAKKQARWQAHQEYKRSLLSQFIATELKDLQGRTRREARAEATWKWRHKLEEDRKAELRRRWKNRGAEADLLRKKARKTRKESKQREKLRNLVLPVAPNQVVPAGSRVS